jgi:hypothetical protein
VGGTLAVADGVAVAADPDRDVVHVVDLESATVLRTIALQAGDEPGRVAIGDGVAHVVLRGGGGIASIGLGDGTITRRSVCSDPRGIAHDPDAASLYVACADGSFVQLDETSGTEIERQLLQPDLRDVVMLDGQPYVSLFRQAALRHPDGSLQAAGNGDIHVPHVAWRTIANPNAGGIVMLHQLTSIDFVPLTPSPDGGGGEDGDGGFDGGGGGDFAYGGGGGCQPGITLPALSVMTPDQDLLSTVPLLETSLVVDAAVSNAGAWVAVAMPGAEEKHRTAKVMSLGDSGCSFGGDPQADEEPNHPLSVAQVTSVAFSGSTLVMFSREPAQIILQHGVPDGELEIIELEGDSRYDTGHEIFHRATESGLSCASCHPEGTDDGHVWTFDSIGMRRTQSLDQALAETAPFHWDGEMDDLDMIMAEVLAHRMGGKRQTDERADSFARWLFDQKRPPARAAVTDETLVGEGEQLFAETFMGNELQVPT